MTGHADALLEQAAALHRQGRGSEAIALFRQVLATRPESSEGWYELGYLLKAEGEYEQALDAYAQALARGVRRPEEVHLNRAVIYSDHLRRDADAERELESALAIAPDYVPALLNMGNLHEERGRRELALACYERVLAGADRQDDAHRELAFEALARSAKLRPPTSVDDPLLERLRKAASDRSDKVVRANLLFALGQAHDGLGQVDLAFDAFAKANRWLLRHSGRTYDRAQSSRLVDALIESFQPVAGHGGQPRTAAQPLFVCGMFRSGSTLVEQVLAAHPQVTAGGELDYLRRLAATRLVPFPGSMATLDPDRDSRLAAEYHAHLLRLFPEAGNSTFVTDKRPDNFILIGLIKRLFPGAKIIHSVRNPMDNGLSLFMQHLNPLVAGYSTDLGDIGHYYGQYRRLMAHWKALYPDDIHDFDYDAFVHEPEASLARLLQFLGLPWDDRCLQFHRLDNTVKTASYWQVRQPLHARASERWIRYLPHLAPLQQALREAGIAEREIALG